MSRLRCVVIVAPAGPTRHTLVSFLSDRGVEPIVLRREDFLASQDVLIEQDRLRIDGVDVLERATAAVVLDSGLMWPVPVLAPSEETWSAFHGRFDEYLRNERETESFWYSVLDVINDRLSLCINPQTAFAHYATKPAAFARLADESLPIVPTVLTNDESELRRFVYDFPEPWAAVPLVGGAPCRWDRRAVEAALESGEPVFLQAFGDAELELQSLGGVVVASEPVPPEVRDRLPEVHRVLGAPWLTLTWRRRQSLWELADFDPAPKLESLSSHDRSRVLDELARLMEEAP